MMPLSEILFLAIVVYLLYRFIINFLLPIVRTTRHVREQFRNMQGGQNPGDQTGQPFQEGQPFQQGRSNQQKQQGAAGATGAASASGRQSSTRPPAEDYIDFEEIK